MINTLNKYQRLWNTPGLMRMQMAQKIVDDIFATGCALTDQQCAFLDRIALSHAEHVNRRDERRLDSLHKRAIWMMRA